jgi:nitrite reductase/ring-hydroxylating ferredoxin subunit
MSSVRVYAVRREKLDRDKLVDAVVGGRHYVLVAYGGKYYCYDGLCPDRQSVLGRGQLQGKYLMCSCPYQQSVFDVTTGLPLSGSPDPTPLRAHSVVVEEDKVYIELDQ